MTHTEWLSYWLQEPAKKLNKAREIYLEERMDELMGMVSTTACMEDFGLTKTSTKGTEPMTTTTTTEVSVTERTSKDIVKSVRDGVYITKNRQLIVGHDWDGDLTVARNPATTDNNSVNLRLSAESIEEISRLGQLLKASRDGEQSEWRMDAATYELNTAGK